MQGQRLTYTCAAFLEAILSRSTLSFDPIGVFFWPTYQVDPPGVGLFALVKCVQWHTPLMCKYRLYWYNTLGWPIAYWSENAVCILLRLQVDKKLILQWAHGITPMLMETLMENNQWMETLNVRNDQNVFNLNRLSRLLLYKCSRLPPPPVWGQLLPFLTGFSVICWI